MTDPSALQNEPTFKSGDDYLDDDAGLPDGPRPKTNRPMVAMHEGWIWGLALMLVGVLLLLRNAGWLYIGLYNWWALFILIPAVGKLAKAAGFLRAGGRVGQALSELVSAAILVLLALTFLLNWPWRTIWPFFLIGAGLTALTAGLDRRPERE